MTCEKYKILIHDLVEGELESETANDLNLHIFACRSCEAEFEMLNSEKEVYSQFLFEVEPPNDLSAKFQARLKSENREEAISAKTPSWFAGVFDLLTFKPIFAAAIVVIVLGIGYIWLKNSIENKEKTIVLQPQGDSNSPNVTPANKAFIAENPNSRSPEITEVRSIEPKQSEKIPVKKTISSEEKPKIFSAVLRAIKKPEIIENKPQKSIDLPKTKSEDDSKFKQFQEFESETAKHLERTEMMLRSFRNARYVEESNEYDVSFEKQQARKLLAANVKLRGQAENFGTPLTNEMLNKVEPYLLDIANLNEKPSEDEVLEIKKRVKNQNLIASLQGF